MATINAKITDKQVKKLLNKIVKLAKSNEVDRFFAREAFNAKRTILTRTPTVPVDTGNLQKSYLPRKIGFAHWELYSRFADDDSGSTPYGLWQERGRTPSGRRFRNYSRVGSGRGFIRRHRKKIDTSLKENFEKELKKIIRKAGG